jgi:hypothetical protein
MTTAKPCFAGWVRLLRQSAASANAAAFVSCLLTCLLCTGGGAAIAQTNVLTYHYDANRTGWNANETSLTAANVGGGAFGLVHTVTVDDQIDAQPLIVSNQTIAGSTGTHEVAYVVTENDSVYAIDAMTGTILKQVSLGTAVAQNNLPGACNNNADRVGINSTPVIDLAGGTLYVITYTWESGNPVHRIHALDLKTLADKVPSVPIDKAHGASHLMPNGGTYRFNPATQRQRSALLEANGNIYAGFASFCDFDENDSRGWILGWQASTLAPLAHNELINRLVNQTVDCPFNNNHPPCFLASVWMSGYGVAADATGNIFAVTGNGGPGTYDGNFAIQESVVELSGNLQTVESLFTPTDTSGPNDVGVNAMDKNDNDLGSGGVMLLPNQPGPLPHLAVAQGKIGPLYLLNRDKTGSYGTSGAVATVQTEPGCWCGPSYFVASDGVGRVITSTAGTLAVWKVQTTPSVTLVEQSSNATLAQSSVQDPGFMTSVSSNNTSAGSAVVWAVPHAANWNTSTKAPNVTLYAFNPANASNPIFQAPAGFWPYTGGNANIVPVVANGRVFVASYRTLAIFALGGTASLGTAPSIKLRPLLAQGHEIYGTVEGITGTELTVRTRTGSLVRVDTTAAANDHNLSLHGVGGAVDVRGTYGANGVLRAQSVARAKTSPGAWEPDR